MDIIDILKSKGVKVLSPEESAEAVDLNDPCVFCSVCHYMYKDGNKLNNNVNNLEWVNYSENTQAWHENKIKQERKPTEYYSKDLPNEIWKSYKNYFVSLQSKYVFFI